MFHTLLQIKLIYRVNGSDYQGRSLTTMNYEWKGITGKIIE